MSVGGISKGDEESTPVPLDSEQGQVQLCPVEGKPELSKPGHSEPAIGPQMDIEGLVINVVIDDRHHPRFRVVGEVV